MSKISKEKRDKIILIGMGTVVACVAIYFLLINAQKNTLNRVNDEARKSREQLETGQRVVKSQAAVKQEYAAARESLRQRESAMASPSDMYLWQIETLNRFRAGRNVEIPQFGREMPGNVQVFPKFPYNAATFNIRGSAHFHDFGKFLADFENAFPYIRVQNLVLEPASGDQEKSESREKLSFRMELLTLVRPNAI
jgi:Tfp pilus assembly protein PilO